MKKWNRQAENALLTAEKWCAIAAKVLGRAYPADDLRRAWKCVLFNQFHDILSGTCAPEAYEDARNQYGEALSIAQRAANSAMQALAWRIRIPQEEGAQTHCRIQSARLCRRACRRIAIGRRAWLRAV